MLKLTQALIKQSDQVYHRLSQYLSKNSDFDSDQDMRTGLSSTVIQGFFILVSHLGQKSLVQDESSSTDELLSLESCKAYLTSLSFSETVMFFLAVEKVVMSSGQGKLFQSWRDSWQQTLIFWLRKAENAQRLKDHLSALLPLNDAQIGLQKSHNLDLKMLSQKIAEYFSGYLEGRGALSRQLVILLNPSQKIPWSLMTHQIQETMQSNLVEALQSLNAKHSKEFSQVQSYQFTAQAGVPFVTISRFLRTFLRTQSAEKYALVHSFIYGLPLPKFFRKTPKSSLRLWLLRECKSLLEDSTFLPSCLLIENAEDLLPSEFSFWSEIVEVFRSLGQPFALILKPSRTSLHEEDPSLFFFKRRMILCEEFGEGQGGVENSKLGERLSSWDQRWSLALLGYHQADHDLANVQRYDLPEVDFDLWLTSFLKLSPDLQVLLICYLSPLRSYFEGGLLGTALSDLLENSAHQAHLDILISAGWLKLSGGKIKSTTQILDSVVWHLSQSLDHLAQITPKGAQALLKFASNILAEVTHFKLELIAVSESVHQVNLKLLEAFAKWLEQLSQILDEVKPVEIDRILNWINQLDSSNSINKPKELDSLKLIHSLSHQAHYSPLLQSMELESAELFEYQEELASVSGDLALLAKVFQLRAYWYCRKDLLLPMLDDLSNAHQIFGELALDEEAFECRASFILLLAQSGLVDIAKPLLNMEYSTQEFLSVEDDICMIAGLVSAQQNEWSLALTYFAGVNKKTSESIIWEAVSSLKSILEFSQEPRAQQKLYQELATDLDKTLSQIDVTQINSFDLYALYTWVQVLVMVILNKTSDFPFLYTRLNHLVNQEGLSRGHLYCAWAAQCLKRYHEYYCENLMIKQDRYGESLVQSKATLESATMNLERLSIQLDKAWRNGYELILDRLQSDQQILNRLFSPHCYHSQQRSLAHLPQSRTNHHLKIWELNESGDLGVFEYSKL